MRVQNAFSLPPMDRLRALFTYDPETGIVRRRATVHAWATKGSVVGTAHNDGYLKCSVDGRQYLLHRLVWLHFHGMPPSSLLDHINGCRSDNRICNLREADAPQNMWNRGALKARVKGAFYRKDIGKWLSFIRVRGQRVFLGHFGSAEEAGAAYAEAAELYHGEFANTIGKISGDAA